MFIRLGHVLALIAFLSAIGAHWQILQSVAWTTMLAENLRTSSLARAVERTFNGKHPCALCKTIAKGKQSEKKSDFQPDSRKFEFSHTSTLFIFSAPVHFLAYRLHDDSFSPLSQAPAVPPPKSFLP